MDKEEHNHLRSIPSNLKDGGGGGRGHNIVNVTKMFSVPKKRKSANPRAVC